MLHLDIFCPTETETETKLKHLNVSLVTLVPFAPGAGASHWCLVPFGHILALFKKAVYICAFVAQVPAAFRRGETESHR